MNRISLSVALVGAALFIACAHTEEKPRVFEKKGGVLFHGGSASWDEDEVVGPLTSIAKRSDGSWAGTINGQVIDVNVYSNRAAGAYLTMKWNDEGPNRIITAQFNNAIYRFEIYPDKVEVRTPGQGYTLPLSGDWSFGPAADLKFEGEGQQAKAPMPQFGLAILGTFVSSGAVGHSGSGDMMPQNVSGASGSH